MRLLRRAMRRLAEAAGTAGLQVVFDRSYGAAIPGIPLDPERGALVLAALVERGIVGRRAIHQPRLPRMASLLLAHTAQYLASLQDPDVMASIVGVTLPVERVEEIVRLQRLAAGGTIFATRLALVHRVPAVNLGGGYHHAGPDRGAGFCAINDVAIAVRRLQGKGYRRPVAIVDLDLHHGNGTRAVFADDPSVHTLSLHNTGWDDRPAVASTDVALGSGVGDEQYLDALRATLPDVLAAHRPGLVVYVAGTDPAEDDALGDWRITPAGLMARDRFVVEQVRALCGPRTPLVIVLAGGYGFNAWRHTARFLGWLASGRPTEPPDDMDVALQRFRAAFPAVRRTLVGGSSGGDWRLSDDDLWGPGQAPLGETRLLGRFTLHGVELLFERAGVVARLRALGYREPVLAADLGSGVDQTLRVYGEPERINLLVETRLRRERRIVPGCEVLFCEWLLLQNPGLRFSDRLPALPGQQHPGLGMLGTAVAFLVLMAEELGLDGVANVPSHYFVAAVGRRHLRFLDPAAQARFEALADALRGRDADEAERLLAAGRVVDAGGAPVRWEPSAMVIPISARLREALGGEAYEMGRSDARSRLGFRVAGEPPAGT